MNRLKKGLLLLSLLVIIIIPKQTTSLAVVKPTLEAIIPEYNDKGYWQNERTITIERVGMHRTNLEPNKEYDLEHVCTELGPNRQIQFVSYCKCKGKVAFFDNWKGCENFETMIDLAIKDGAVAFLMKNKNWTDDDSSKKKKLYDIPFFVTASNMPSFFSNSKIKLKKEEEEDNSTQSLEENNSNNKSGDSEKCDNISLDQHHSDDEEKMKISSREEIIEESNSSDSTSTTTSLSQLAKANGISMNVIEQLNLSGVNTVDDAAFMYITQEEERLESSSTSHHHADDLLPTNFTLKDVGIGGLSKELETLFRRTIVTRLLKAETLDEMGINPVRGLLLHGPPGCGKTLIARKLSQLLNAKKITIKSGSEMFSKWLGESEANIRALFKDAEDEWKEKDMKSGLHVIIIDEVDAICSAIDLLLAVTLMPTILEVP